MHTETNSSKSKNGTASGRLLAVRRLIYCTVIFVCCTGFLAECDQTTPEQPPSPPDTVMNVEIDRWVIVEAGGSVSVVVDSGTNNTQGRTLPANVGDTVSFAARASTDDNGVVSCEWDFQDDGAFDATGVMSSFTFTVAGACTVRLRVTDTVGQIDEATATVEVTDSGGGGTPTVFSIGVIFEGNGVVNVNPPNVTLPKFACCDGSVCGISDLAAGDSYTLTATATDPLGSFAGWDPTGCDSFDNDSNCIINLQSDRVVTASFLSGN